MPSRTTSPRSSKRRVSAVAKHSIWQGGFTAADQNVIDVNASAANLLGITYLAAAGDSGAADCVEYGTPGLYVDLPRGVSPVLVHFRWRDRVSARGAFTTGGARDTSPRTAPAEEVWNEANPVDNRPVNLPSSLAAAGSASSSTSPPYQIAIPTCSIVGALPVSAGITPSAMREVPDLSFTAATSGNNPLYLECTIPMGRRATAAATGGH